MLQLAVSNSALATELASCTARVEFVNDATGEPVGYFIPECLVGGAPVPPPTPIERRLSVVELASLGELAKPAEWFTSDGELLGFFVPDSLELREQSARARRFFLSHTSTATRAGGLTLRELMERVHQSLGMTAEN
jgi:hypothetical protein